MKKRSSLKINRSLGSVPATRPSRRAFSLVKCLGLGLGVAAIAPNHTMQAQSTWVGGTSQDANNAANWSAGLPNGVNAIINTATGNYPILTTDAAFTPVDIILGNGGANAGRLDQTAGTLSTGTGNWFFVQDGSSANSVYNLADTTTTTTGTLTGFGMGTGSLNVGGANTATDGRLIVGNGGSGTGTLNINTSGTISAHNSGVGFLIGTNGGKGIVNVDNGIIDTSSAWFGDNNAASTGTLNMGPGGILLTSGITYFGRGSGTGNLNLSGGTIISGGNFIAGFNAGTGNVNVTSGTISGGAEVWFGEGNSTTGTGTGNGTVGTGGTISSTTWMVIGRDGASNGTLTLNGGTVNVRIAGTTGALELADFDSAKGTLNINAGSNVNLQNNAGINFGSVNNGATGVGIINQNAGNVTFYSDSGVTATGSTGALTMGAGTSAGTYTYNLNGGTLTVPTINKTTTGAATAIFNFNGGTIVPTGATTTFMQGLTTANVRNGGALFNTNGLNITVAQPLVHSTVSGDNTTDGGLAKSGTGTLTLSGANSYNGPTTVSAGTLAFSTAQSTLGVMTVAGGANLGARTRTGATTLTLSSLTFGASGLVLDFNGQGNPTAPLISSSGVLTLNGTVSVSLANLGALTTTPNNTTLPLLTYSSQTGTGTFNLATATAGHSNYALNDTATALYLSVTAASNVWTGATNNVWDINTTSNWSLGKYLDGDVVIFDDTGANTNPVSLGVTVTPGSVTFNNATKTYTISGAGTIAGSGALTKNGAGTVSLLTANTYTGGTTINAGILAINSATSLGDASGALTLNAGTLEATANITATRNVTLGSASSTILTDTGVTYASSGVFSGTGALNKTGAGTLVLTGANTYTGGTTINAGTVAINSAASLGATSGALTLNAGTLETTATFTSTRAVTLGSASSTISPDTGTTYTNSGVFSGSGALNMSGAGALTLTGANTYTGGTTLTAGTLTIGGAANSALGTGSLTLNGGTLASTSNGGANFDPTLTNAIVVGANGGAIAIPAGTATHINGNITGSGALGLSGIYNGSGLTLGGDNSGYTGTVTVTGANVRLDAATATSAAASWVVTGNLQTDTAGATTYNLGALSGAGVIDGHATNAAATVSTLSVGALGTSTTFSGVIQNNAANSATTGNLDAGSNNVLALTKVGAGTLTLTGANTYTGATTVSGGTLQLGDGTTDGTIAATSGVTVGTGATLAFNRAGAITSAFPISGAGNVSMSGAGTQTLTAAETYAGTTSINAGRLNFTTAQSSGLGGFTVASGATLGLQRLGAGTTVASTGGLSFGTGTTNLVLDLNGLANPTTALATFGGALTKGGTISVSLANFSALTTATSIPLLTYASESGAGAFSLGTTSFGHTTFALNDTATALYLNVTANPNVWTGATNNTWDINTTTNWSLGKYLDGDQVVFNDTASQFGVNIAQTVTPGSVTFSNTAAHTYTISGAAIAGTGPVTLNGTGTVVLTNANTYTGTTTIGTGATLQLGNGTTDGTINTSSGIVDNGTLVYNRSTGSSFTYANVISGTGAVTVNGAGTQILTAAETYTGATTIGTGATLQLGDGTTDGSINNSANIVNNGTLVYNRSTGSSFTYANVISGTGAVAKSGAGTQILSGANTYSGGTTISAGPVLANSNTALGTGNITLGATTGAQLQLGSGVNVANALTINGGGAVLQGAVYVPTANSNATYSGPITINAVTGAGGDFAANGGTLTVTGAITASVPVTTRIGTVVFTNPASTYTQLNVQQGTFRLGATNVIPTAASVGLGASGAAIFDLGGFNQTLAGLTLTANTGTVTNSGTADSTLTTTGTSTFGGVVQDGATNKVAVAVNGGALTLTGASAYTGGTTVNAGTLIANRSNNSLNPATSSLGNPQAAQNITVNNGGTLQFAQGDTLGGSDSAIVATLVINAGGTVSNVGTNFNALGPLVLNGGTLTTSGGAVPLYQSYSLNSTVTVGGTTASSISVTGAGNANNGIHLGANTIFTVADATSSAASDLNVSAPLVDRNGNFGGVAGGFTKAGAGTMTLSAVNTYTGPTTVNGGILTIASTGSINGSTAVQVTSGALTLQSTAVLGDTSTLSLATGTTLNLGTAAGGNEVIGMLVLNGTAEQPGTYTALALNLLSASQGAGVTFTSAGGETLTVTAVPEPSTWALGLASLGLMAGWSQRRRAQAWLRLSRQA